VVAAAARIVQAARVSVTADIEAGYGEAPDAVMRSIPDVIEAGAVGVNLEDGTGVSAYAK
jgi:2-methylisocitrate lyase-like PEP mutase family enzyme